MDRYRHEAVLDVSVVWPCMQVCSVLIEEAHTCDLCTVFKEALAWLLERTIHRNGSLRGRVNFSCVVSLPAWVDSYTRGMLKG